MIPDEAREALEQFFPSLPWNDVQLTVGNLPMSTIGPMALIPRAAAYLSLTGVSRALRAVGMTIGRHIYIQSGHADFNTAAGLALLAHEFEHVQQGERDPNFAENYDAEAQRTPANQPWLNKYEMAAYMKEAQVYRELLAKGMRPGNWLPLMVSRGVA